MTTIDDFEQEFKDLLDRTLENKSKANLGPGTSQAFLEKLSNFLPNKVWEQAIKNEIPRDKNKAKDIEREKQKKKEAIAKAKR